MTHVKKTTLQSILLDKCLQSSIDSINIERNGWGIKYTICLVWITSPQIRSPCSRNKQVSKVNNNERDEESVTCLRKTPKKELKGLENTTTTTITTTATKKLTKWKKLSKSARYSRK